MENKRVSTSTNPIKVNTLGMDIALPEGGSVTPYQVKNDKKQSKNAKQRQKYSHFSYYRLKDSTVLKILFLTADTYIEISRFPFVESSDVTKVQNFKELNDSGAARIVTADSLLIGIQNKDTVLVRKLELCKVSETDAEVDTIEDIFESIPYSNQQRYNQVLSSLKEIQMASLRVIIQEESEKATILDYDYFFAERQFARRHSQVSVQKPVISDKGKVETEQGRQEVKKGKKKGQEKSERESGLKA